MFRNIISNMAKSYPDQDTRAGMLEQLHECNLVHSVTDIVQQHSAGADIQPVHEISAALDIFSSSVAMSSMPEVDDNINDLLDDASEDNGVHWRLPCLNASMRGLRGGDFGILAARPDQGKTSFICSEVTYMAGQLPEGRPVVWFNNEGPGLSIYPRLMQAAMNCSMQTLIDKKEAGTLYDDYYKIVGEDRIRVMDIHGYNTGQVEDIIAKVNPGIIIYDMIDNIRGFGSAARNDLQLEYMYQWAREKAVKYDSIALATSQISNEGADTIYPGLGMLKDSKTGKQGACDFQLMVGSMETKPEYANTRWLSLPKNKLRRVQSPTLREQVVFDREFARYRTIATEDVVNDPETIADE